MIIDWVHFICFILLRQKSILLVCALKPRFNNLLLFFIIEQSILLMLGSLSLINIEIFANWLTYQHSLLWWFFILRFTQRGDIVRIYLSVRVQQVAWLQQILSLLIKFVSLWSWKSIYWRKFGASVKEFISPKRSISWLILLAWVCIILTAPKKLWLKLGPQLAGIGCR
jgi:hypothetical membrane protein